MEFEDTDGAYFLLMARLANLVPIHTPYVPYGILHRALISEYRRHRHPCSNVLRWELTPAASVFGRMFESMSEVWASESDSGTSLTLRCSTGAGISPNAWAHASCTTCHKGCVGVGFSMLEKAAAFLKLAKAGMNRSAREKQLLDESRWELLSDGDDEKQETKELFHYDKMGKKKPGPDLDYGVGGCVQAV